MMSKTFCSPIFVCFQPTRTLPFSTKINPQIQGMAIFSRPFPTCSKMAEISPCHVENASPPRLINSWRVGAEMPTLPLKYVIFCLYEPRIKHKTLLLSNIILVVSIGILIMAYYNPYMGVSKNRGKNPKMDGENNGNPYLRWMIWRENPLFSETFIYVIFS